MRILYQPNEKPRPLDTAVGEDVFNQHDGIAYTKNKYGDIIIVGGGGVSKGITGVMFDFGGTTAPVGSLSCDGQELSKADYVELYAAIGDSWATTGGASAPATDHFRLPPQQIEDLGLYMRGVGGTNGAVGTYQEDVFKSHNHTSSAGTGGVRRLGTGDATAAASGSATGNEGSGVETRPRSITVLKCIWI